MQVYISKELHKSQAYALIIAAIEFNKTALIASKILSLKIKAPQKSKKEAFMILKASKIQKKIVGI